MVFRSWVLLLDNEMIGKGLRRIHVSAMGQSCEMDLPQTCTGVFRSKVHILYLVVYLDRTPISQCCMVRLDQTPNMIRIQKRLDYVLERYQQFQTRQIKQLVDLVICLKNRVTYSIITYNHNYIMGGFTFNLVFANVSLHICYFNTSFLAYA